MSTSRTYLEQKECWRKGIYSVTLLLYYIIVGMPFVYNALTRYAYSFASLLKDIWYNNLNSIAPLAVKKTIGEFAPRFGGFQQHDSQELLMFLLDGLHEDLNRVLKKPYVEVINTFVIFVPVKEK